MTRKHFLSITFAVQYLNQKTPNDTPVSHFLPGNIQDNINTFDESKISFFVKPGDVQKDSVHQSIKRVELGRKMLKGIPNRVIYMATSTFKNKYGELKKCSYGPFSTKSSPLLVDQKICWYGLFKYWFSIS